jgi:predicted transcriptional regulator of viral defense system
MKFSKLMKTVGDEPLFETGFLLAGEADALDVRRQLSRWTQTGRLYKLRRGLYALAPPYQKFIPHPFRVANQLLPGSYVSCQSVLAYYGLIPEYVAVTTSVTAARPARWETALGVYEFRHIKPDLFFGYQLIKLAGGQEAFVAAPEKALLDLIYLQPGGDMPAYLQELRLQNLERLDLDLLARIAARIGRPKLQRVATLITDIAGTEMMEYSRL